MKVLILCGGKGTRLRPFTYVLPKPLFPFNDKVVLHNLIDHLGLQGFEDLTLSLGYKGSFIKNYCESENLDVKYITESSPLGTVGPIKLMQEQDFDNLLLLNGDIITTMNFRKMEKDHNDQNSDITIACKEYCRKIPFGDIIHDENNNIIKINEKPVHKSEVSIGISIIRKNVLELISNGENMDIPGLVALAISKGLRVKCYHLLSNEQWNALEHFKQFNDEKIESIEEI
jgi:mannose-1-phosphate guanylyltransferase